MASIGEYCFHWKPLAWIGAGALVILLFAPSVLQAMALLLVGTCPVTMGAIVWKAAGVHRCGEEPSEQEREPLLLPVAPQLRPWTRLMGHHPGTSQEGGDG